MPDYPKYIDIIFFDHIGRVGSEQFFVSSPSDVVNAVRHAFANCRRDGYFVYQLSICSWL